MNTSWRHSLTAGLWKTSGVPFFTTKDTGLGLGLISVKAVVEAHGGTIRVGSSPLGGASFTIQIPVEASQGEK